MYIVYMCVVKTPHGILNSDAKRHKKTFHMRGHSRKQMNFMEMYVVLEGCNVHELGDKCTYTGLLLIWNSSE